MFVALHSHGQLFVSDPRPKFESGYAPVNGLKLYYEIHGVADPRSPPLVLLHGGGSTIDTSFGKVIEQLAKNRQVIAFDQQGHGRTADIVDRPFSFERSANDAVELIRYLKIPRADFAGFSNGGHIALDIGIHHPAAVRKLVIISAMFKRDGADPQFWDGFRGVKLETMPAELKDEYLKVSPHPEQLQSFFDKSVKRMLDFKDWTTQDICSINAPTLVIAGDADIVRPEHAVEMFRLLPHARLAILPNTDHMQIMTRSDLQVPMIEEFLNAGELK